MQTAIAWGYGRAVVFASLAALVAEAALSAAVNVRSMQPTAGDRRVTRPGPDGTPPRLSVLVPAWQSAASIAQALGSVLEETSIALECIVVDDGSTDGTPDVVEAIAARDPRVVLIRLAENAGVSAARNRGLEVARGEWLAFLDADDRLLPGAIAALMRPTADPAVRAVVGQRIWTDGERRWLSPVYDDPDIREPGRKAIATHPGLLFYASATGKAFHRSLVDGLRFEGRVLGDQPWTIRALLRAGDRIEVIGDTVYEWRRPAPGTRGATITAVTRASAARSIEIAAVARTAFAEVSAEVDAQLPDPAARLEVKRAYLDRLIRSDLAVPVTDAIDRHDPATASLLREVGRFLASVPAPVLARSTLLARRILRPPVVRWRSLDPGARSAYWTILDRAADADPTVGRRVGGLALRPAYALVRSARRAGGDGDRLRLVLGRVRRRSRSAAGSSAADGPGRPA